MKMFFFIMGFFQVDLESLGKTATSNNRLIKEEDTTIDQGH